MDRNFITELILMCIHVHVHVHVHVVMHLTYFPTTKLKLLKNVASADILRSLHNFSTEIYNLKNEILTMFSSFVNNSK